MKRLLIPLFALTISLSLHADNAAPGTTTSPATAAPTPDAAHSFIPSVDFQPARYETLWTKSPFSVATPDGPTDTSPDYALYGIANIDGITYASIVDAHTNEHFLISSDKPTRGLTLNGITREPNGGDTFANVMKDGQLLTLKLAAAPAPVAGATPVNGALPQGGPAPGGIVPNITAPGAGSPFGNSSRPFPRIHRPHITLPPPPAPAPAPPPPAAH